MKQAQVEQAEEERSISEITKGQRKRQSE